MAALNSSRQLKVNGQVVSLGELAKAWLEKFNPNHDAKGRFAEGGGGGKTSTNSQYGKGTIYQDFQGKPPWKMSQSEYEKSYGYEQSSWDEIQRDAPYVSKTNDGMLVTVSPSTTEVGKTRLNYYSNRGIEYHEEVANSNLNRALRERTYPRNGKILTLEGGLKVKNPDTFNLHQFRVGAMSATGSARTLVGPSTASDRVRTALRSLKVEVKNTRDVPENIQPRAGLSYWTQGRSGRMVQVPDYNILRSWAKSDGLIG